MSDTPEWLTRDDVLKIHRKMLDLYGGLEGVRDQNALESAIKKLNIYTSIQKTKQLS